MEINTEINTKPKYALHIGWTDVEPYEIIKHITERTIEIRRMKTERDPTWEPVAIVGGFSAHIVNNEDQRWIFSSDPERTVFRIRLGKKGWKAAFGDKFVLAFKPRKFYDYNF